MQFTQNGPHVRASFIPFNQMNAHQQAEHLVLAHGMGATYWANSTGAKTGDLPDDAAVIDWYLTAARWNTVGHRAFLHEDDHDYLLGHEGFVTHDHLKGV